MIRIIKEWIDEYKIKWLNNIHEVKYFHPSGMSLPNGVYYEHGYFLNECRKNKNSYILDESVYGEQYGLYSVGNFFKGKFVGDNGEMYSEKSISIEINGLSSISLFKLSENLAKAFQQETVLVKDLNRNKIYLVDSKKTAIFELYSSRDEIKQPI